MGFVGWIGRETVDNENPPGLAMEDIEDDDFPIGAVTGAGPFGADVGDVIGEHFGILQRVRQGLRQAPIRIRGMHPLCQSSGVR